MFGARPLPRTLEAALRDLSAERAPVRAASVRDLVVHAGEARERVIRGLQKALRDDAAEVRAAAATALADAGGAEALPDLLVAVEDQNALVRQMAISALGEIGDARATERLRRALGDPRAEVRFQAVMAFPRVVASSDDAVAALVSATQDEDAFVCHIALRMTDEVRGEAAPHPDVLRRARALCGHASPQVRVAAAILVAHGSDDPDDRAKAGEILAEVGKGTLRTGDREDEAAAIELCGALDLRAALPGLERRAFGGLLGLRKDPLAWHARVALARMGHERASREILKELGDRDRDVCSMAVAAAGRARLVAARERLVALKGDARRADPDVVDDALAALTSGAPPRRPVTMGETPKPPAQPARETHRTTEP